MGSHSKPVAPSHARMGLNDCMTHFSLLLLRQDTKLLNLNMKRLRKRNLTSDESVVARTGPVVSITTWGERLQTAYLALESIAQGKVRPKRLILWIDDPEALKNRPETIRRLERRGLEVYASDNFGPHTKYYPYLISTDSFEDPLVTADDDVMYSKWWLEGLVRSYAQNPDVVSCYRAHVIKITHAEIAPYKEWTPCRSTDASFHHFATGVSGCIYPASLLTRIKHAGTAFRESCPNADDIWFHLNALRGGYKVKQLRSRSIRFPSIPGTQRTGLLHSNVGLARNDEQIKNTYTSKDVALITESERLVHSMVEYKSMI